MKVEGGYHWSGDYTWIDIKDQTLAGYSSVGRGGAFSRTTPAYRGNVALGWADAKWAADGYVRYVGGFDAYKRRCDAVSANGYEGFVLSRHEAKATAAAS